MFGQSLPYSGNTTNLTYHLQRSHSKELVELREKTDGKAGPSGLTAKRETVAVQQSLPGTVEQSLPFSSDSMKHKRLVDATADFICQSLQPLRIVDEISFRTLLQTAEPRFQLPHRAHFTTKVIPTKYRQVRAGIEQQLATVEKCTLTTDLWTSQYQQRSYISLTVHFVDSNFDLKCKCLQTLEVLQDHSASSLSEVLKSMLQDWNISEKVYAGVTDNGSNIVNAIGLLGIEHFPCFAHTLQLAIKRGLDVPRVQRVLGRCKKLVEHFKKSNKETYKLREKQNMLKLPEHKLIQDCVTRWGSTLAMLERLMEQQAAIAAVLMDEKVRRLMPEGEEWTIIEQLVEILTPFQQATEAMGAVKYSTLSMVKPLLYKLSQITLNVNDSDTATVKQVKTTIKNDLDGRYQTAALQRIMNVAMYLDPHYKELPFLTLINKQVMVEQVEDELMEMQPQESEEPEREIEEPEPPAKKLKKGPVTKLLGDLFESQEKSSSHSDDVEKELNLYKAEQPADLESNPLTWWKERQSLYPLMSKLVRKVLSFVATSVPSEQLFSTSGNITEKRSCLSSEHADQLIVFV